MPDMNEPSAREARQTVLIAAKLVRERFEQEMKQLIELAAKEEGLDLSEGWQLHPSGNWIRKGESP